MSIEISNVPPIVPLLVFGLLIVTLFVAKRTGSPGLRTACLTLFVFVFTGAALAIVGYAIWRTRQAPVVGRRGELLFYAMATLMSVAIIFNAYRVLRAIGSEQADDMRE